MKRLLLLAALAMPIASPGASAGQMVGNLKCVNVRTEGDGTYNPQFVISNGCADVVFWVMCVNYPSKVDNEYYEGILQPGEEAWVETYPEVGEQFGVQVRFQTTSPDVEYPSC
jgi:hypothetical protein